MRPCGPGDGGEQFREAFESTHPPARSTSFGPDLIVISAGFDAHQADPLGNLQPRRSGLHVGDGALADMATAHANGRIVSMLEGGYDLTALAKSVGGHVRR